MKVTEKISGANAQTNAWVELIDYNQDDPQDIVGYLPDEPEHSTESTAEADDNPETEEQRQQEQEIFNSFIESLPEGAQPESMAYTPDGYKLFMEHLSGLESSHKYPERLLLSTLLNYSDQYLDSGSVMPEDDFFLDESLYEEGGELANLPPNQAKIVERIIEHRLEHLPSEIERKLQEALNRMDEPEKPYGFGETPPPSPQSTIMTTVRDIADYRKFAKDPHQFDGVDQFLHEKCLPKLLEANESQPKNRNSMEAIMVMAKYAPETLEGTQSQIIDAAKFINAHFNELRDYDSRYYMTERLANYTYNNPDNETIVDANGNLTDAFQKRVFLDPGVLMNYTLNGTYEDHGYNQRMINITESILLPSQITALRTVSESGFGKASEAQSLNIVYGAYGNCETDEDRDRITTSIRALAEKDEHGVPLKIVADIIRRHPEIDFSTTDPESEIETSEAIFAIRSVANSVRENPDRRSTTSLLDRCRLLKRINISNPDTRKKLNQKLVDFVSSKENIDETTVNETIEISRAFERFTNQFTNSNSLEIRRISDEITSELIDSGFIQNEDGSMGLSLDGLHEKADHIEDVFLHNNLPMLAKKLLVFQTLHPPENFDKDFKEKPHLSPTILEADNRGPEGEYGIILRDLIHCSVESNSLELRKYLESLRDGQIAIDRIESGESSFENLSEDEQKLAQSFVLKVITAYNENQPDQNRRLKKPDAITADYIRELNQQLGTTSRYSASDRLVRSFGGLAGYHSAEEMLSAMDAVRDAAHERNQQAPKRFIVRPGDLVKNVGGQYLDDILEYGSVCKEFLGGYADSDATPLDTDLTLVGTEADIKSCSEIQNNPNGNYGHVWFVIQNTPDRFRTTRKADDEQPGGEVEPADPRDQRMELFYTGVLGDNHYGIRTGIGSTHIDAIVIEQPEKSSDETTTTQGDFLDRTAFRIVKNGFYIPVYDRKTGDLIFTPDDYENLRAKLSGNHEYRTGEYQFASAEDFASDTERTAGIEIDIADNYAEVARKNAAIQAAFTRAIEGTGLQFRDHIDGDLAPGFIEISSTGSTGRGTNVPGDGDFDYILRVDKSLLDSSQMADIANRIRSTIILNENSTVRGGKGVHDFRTKHVHVEGLPDEIEVDVSYVTRTDKITYATEDAIKDYLSNFSEEQRAQVVRNIIFAKQLFKRPEYHCYKPKHAGGNNEETGASLAEGGLGGVGIENWILQNGGSLTAAARSFLEAAGVTQDNPNAEPVPLETFQQRYPIWDLGANHMSEGENKYPHDNFTQNNLDAGGYSRTVAALKAYLGY